MGILLKTFYRVNRGFLCNASFWEGINAEAGEASREKTIDRGFRSHSVKIYGQTQVDAGCKEEASASFRCHSDPERFSTVAAGTRNLGF